MALTATWAPAAASPWGRSEPLDYGLDPNAVTGATPLANLKAGKIVLGMDKAARFDIPFEIEEGQTARVHKKALLRALLFGRISGTMGVTSALLISIGGLYLFWTKTANRTIIVTLIVTYAALSQILHSFGVAPVPTAWTAVLGGGFLLGRFSWHRSGQLAENEPCQNHLRDHHRRLAPS